MRPPPQDAAGSWRAAAVNVALGTVTAVVVFAAVPTALVSLVGLPLPHHWSREAVVSPRGLFDLLAVTAWAAWAACCWPLLASVVERVRRRDASHPQGGPLAERLAARMAAAVLVLTPVTLLATAGATGASPSAPASFAATAPAAAHVPAVVPATAPAASSPPAGATTVGAAAGAPSPPPPGLPPGGPAGGTAGGAVPATTGAATTTGTAGAAAAPGAAGAAGEHTGKYTVAAGDTLWSIAERTYGYGSDWPLIAQANLGRVMADGTRFVDPSLIRPGWVLTLPAPEDAASPGGAAATPTTPSGGSAEGSGGGATATGGSPPPAPEVATAVAPASAPGGTPAVVHRRRVPPRHRRATAAPSAATRPGGGSGRPVPLPELAALGLGTLVAAALARRARRARHWASLARPTGERPGAVDEGAAETATLLAPFDGAPVLDWLETANRLLTVGLGAGTGAAPGIRALHAGPEGVTARLRVPVTWAPAPWELTDRCTWVLPSTLDPGMLRSQAAGSEPWLPVLVPVGEDDTGTWVVPLQPGACMPVLGTGAQQAVAAMAVGAASWDWAEHVTVTHDPTTAERAVRAGGTPVLYVGDPAGLSTPVRARCGVLTVAPTGATDLTVVVDEHGASIHPLGVAMRPHRLTPERQQAVEQLTAEPDPGGPEPAVDAADPAERLHAAGQPRPGPASGPASATGSAPAAGATPAPPVGPEPAPAYLPRPTPRPPGWHGGRGVAEGPVMPGPVEVRLLAVTPRIDGLADEIAPKRARRAVELVAYLALHQPDPVTGDRLRTRVLGSADADAAAKTLFNTAGAARRALGRDGDGEPYLPPATKSGHYRLSPLVTTDAGRLAALVEAAGGADDPQEAMALLRQALGLIEGEPLAGTLTGYGWWRAEGHERRLAAAAVDGACRLARLATAAGHLELARWGLEQARLVEPYSEALSRAAMEVAAAAGDADALRREWAECQRRVDELDPGGLPAAATERLYAELRRATVEPAGRG